MQSRDEAEAQERRRALRMAQRIARNETETRLLTLAILCWAEDGAALPEAAVPEIANALRRPGGRPRPSTPP